jgi:hypothetical protein
MSSLFKFVSVVVVDCAMKHDVEPHNNCTNRQAIDPAKKERMRYGMLNWRRISRRDWDLGGRGSGSVLEDEVVGSKASLSCSLLSYGAYSSPASTSCLWSMVVVSKECGTRPKLGRWCERVLVRDH